MSKNVVNLAKISALLVAMSLVSACATPHVVTQRKAGDSELTCAQLKGEYADAIEFEEKARKERGLTGTNVAAAIFFWPAMIGTYRNVEEATDAAKTRQKHLERIAAEKGCKI